MQDKTLNTIRTLYEDIAQCGTSGVCGAPQQFYRPDDLAGLPDELLRLSSGCGHPVHLAQIAPGATVLDIGSGAGVDCILAARLTGPTGRVIGVDSSRTMRARAAQYVTDLGLQWVSFVDGTAEALPVSDASVDVVISNCVLALARDPRRVWQEMARVTRPGGRFTVSDVIGGQQYATETTKARCETGVDWVDYVQNVQEAGFGSLQVLRAGLVEFRDEKRVHSATMRGRRVLTPGSVFAQIFHAGLHQPLLDLTSATLVRVARQRGLTCDLELRDLHDEEARGIFALVAAPLASAVAPLPSREVFVVLDGRFAGSWEPTPLEGEHLATLFVTTRGGLTPDRRRKQA